MIPILWQVAESQASTPKKIRMAREKEAREIEKAAREEKERERIKSLILAETARKAREEEAREIEKEARETEKEARKQEARKIISKLVSKQRFATAEAEAFKGEATRNAEHFGFGFADMQTFFPPGLQKKMNTEVPSSLCRLGACALTLCSLCRLGACALTLCPALCTATERVCMHQWQMMKIYNQRVQKNGPKQPHFHKNCANPYEYPAIEEGHE